MLFFLFFLWSDIRSGTYSAVVPESSDRCTRWVGRNILDGKAVSKVNFELREYVSLDTVADGGRKGQGHVPSINHGTAEIG